MPRLLSLLPGPLSGFVPEPFSPANITNMVRWLRSDIVSLDGSDVATWFDVIGGEHLTEATLRPEYLNPCYEANAHPVVKFYRANAERLDAATAASYSAMHKADNTVFLVVMPQSSEALSIILSSAGGSSSTGPGVLVTYDYANMRFQWNWAGDTGSGVGSGDTGIGSADLGCSHVLTARLRPSLSEVDLRFNGAQVYNAPWNTSPSVSDSAHPLRMGDYAATNTSPFDGNIAEMIVYDRELTDTECAQVEAYLLARYVSPAVVPTTEPITPGLDGTVKVLCVGDSITQGLTGAVTRLGGFRQRIDEIRAGLSFTLDFVGTQTFGSFADNEHDGRSGWVIDNRLTGFIGSGHTKDSTNVGTIDDELAALAPTDTPDVVCILLGITTLTAGADSVVLSRDALTDLHRLVLDINEILPDARIVLCPLCLTTGSGVRESRRNAFNCGLGVAAQSLRSLGIKVAIPTTATALLAGDLFDGLHPNDSGYEKLGDSIRDQLQHITGYAS